MSDKAPIFSAIEAEWALVGTLLHRNEWAQDLGDLRREHFENSSLADLFNASVEMVRAGLVANPSTLQTFADNHAHWNFTMLVDLFNRTAPGTRNACLSLGRAITEAARKRGLYAAMQGATAHIAENAALDACDLQAHAEAALKALDAGPSGRVATARQTGAMVVTSIERPRGVRTGYPSMDKAIGGFYPGQLILVAGATGMCKTGFATNLARNMAEAGAMGHVESYEMSHCDLGERLVSAASYRDGRSPIPYFDFAARGNELDPLYVQDMADRLPETLIIKEGAPQGMEQLEAGARATRRALGGLDFIVVDYLQLMASAVRRGSQYERVTEVSQGLKALASRLQVPVIALTQINREASKRGGNRRPRLSDLRDSGALEQDADLVLGVHREYYWLEQDAHDEAADDAEFFRRDAKLEAAKEVLEVLRLKQRRGPLGRTLLRILIEYDIVEEASEALLDRYQQTILKANPAPKPRSFRNPSGDR